MQLLYDPTVSNRLERGDTGGLGSSTAGGQRCIYSRRERG